MFTNRETAPERYQVGNSPAVSLRPITIEFPFGDPPCTPRRPTKAHALMTDPEIRLLVPGSDNAAVRDLYDRAADFVMLESGTEPSDAMVEQFFTDCPPGVDFATSQKLGMFRPSGQLVAIADLAFGYPEADDAYVGLLLLDESCRGMGLGRTFLDHLTGIARARNARRLLIAVLDENARGRAFWEREGFRLLQSFPDFKIGPKTHVAHRMWRSL
ncbi:GNAT superfamily N-acetyltransferase [Aminobacter lissarensis]|uniref:GNAT superfamily N-acetyltransferase n=1 Tax=Aminobacter carboxidus TaxID=376165 RepID=A0A8E1WAE1_9HYPH|nr:GNAT family N-acetyltransferase [Aminobacter lissarensis]MBB6464613.1 GNAT superfamily N-acetyltransferase [Aminobacter lissarensis]